MTAEQKAAAERWWIDSSDEDKYKEEEVLDDGKRDKIFSKFFLRSISNQSKIKTALI
jgi:hypothetical protein